MLDTSTVHPSFKGCRFRAVNIANIKTGEILGYRIIFKNRGRGEKWKYLGNDVGPFEFESKELAVADAKALNEWSRD